MSDDLTVLSFAAASEHADVSADLLRRTLYEWNVERSEISFSRLCHQLSAFARARADAALVFALDALTTLLSARCSSREGTPSADLSSEPLGLACSPSRETQVTWTSSIPSLTGRYSNMLSSGPTRRALLFAPSDSGVLACIFSLETSTTFLDPPLERAFGGGTFLLRDLHLREAKPDVFRILTQADQAPLADCDARACAMLASCVLGIAQNALALSTSYAKQRCAFGVPIIRHQLVAARLADMCTSCETLRLMLWWYLCRIKERSAGAHERWLLQSHALSVSHAITRDGVQTFAGHGYVEDALISHCYWDAKGIASLFEPTAVGSIVTSWIGDAKDACSGGPGHAQSLFAR